MEENKPAASAAPTMTPPSAAPQTQSPANPNVDPAKSTSTPPAVTNEPGVKAGTTKPIARPAGVITNPPPVVDPDAPVQEAPLAPRGVPQSTIDEMAAGKAALQRNQPVARALEDARNAKDAGTVTTPETNPVDATKTLHQQGKV
jgi:hypothetical protein